jgi:hypothetical protein
MLVQHRAHPHTHTHLLLRRRRTSSSASLGRHEAMAQTPSRRMELCERFRQRKRRQAPDSTAAAKALASSHLGQGKHATTPHESIIDRSVYVRTRGPSSRAGGEVRALGEEGT